jgi:D-sedoheptulose 7-phosphate isomerase
MRIDNYLSQYLKELTESIGEINNLDLDKVTKLIIKKIKNNNNIYVCGNGGSAAIANHYVCDFIKFFRDRTIYKPKIISLSNNLETITAISNDISYDQIFKYQAESLANKNDLFIIISSSGNSKNIRELLKFANKKKIKTIGFSGFDGGYLKKNCTLSVHIRAKNYGLSEDAHHILMHVIMQYMILKYGINNAKQIFKFKNT